MSVRLSALVLGVVALLATAALTFAANKTISTAPRAKPQVKAVPLTLVVPDVRRQAYVFAKGILVDAGFAWRVQGGVQGFSANTVATQSPAPGTRVLDTGAPLVVLTLARNGKYGQKGTPVDVSPYAGTPVQIAGLASAQSTQSVLPTAKPAAKPKPGKTALAAPTTKRPKPVVAATTTAAYPQQRPAAFRVAGAPKEPLKEMPLTDRATQLGAWLAQHPKPTNANVKHWLYQHDWVVTGAKFGWWHGAAALKILIQDDKRAMAVWGIGAQSEQVARAALAEVQARTR